MVNFKVRLCAKLLIFNYYLGRASGACTFKYQADIHSTRSSRPTEILVALLRISLVPLFFCLAYIDDPHSFSMEEKNFLTSISTIALASILVSTKQVISGEKYSRLINKAIQLQRGIKSLGSNQELLTQTFFVVLLAVKMVLNAFILIVYMPESVHHLKINLLLAYNVFGVEIFLGFPFLGLLVTASSLETLGKSMNNIRSLKDLDRFAKVSQELHNVFLEFVQLTEWDIFLLMCYYTSAIATSLVWYTQDTENWIDVAYTIYATIYLLMFNLTADKILKYSQLRNFESSKFLTNDSMAVSFIPMFLIITFILISR